MVISASWRGLSNRPARGTLIACSGTGDCGGQVQGEFCRGLAREGRVRASGVNPPRQMLSRSSRPRSEHGQGKRRRGPAQDLIGLPQFAVLAVQRLHLLGHARLRNRPRSNAGGMWGRSASSMLPGTVRQTGRVNPPRQMLIMAGRGDRQKGVLADRLDPVPMFHCNGRNHPWAMSRCPCLSRLLSMKAIMDLPGFCGERLAHFPGLSLEGDWALEAER